MQNDETPDGQDDDPRLGPPDGIVLFAIAFEGALVLVALALGWLFGINPFAQMTADFAAVANGLFATAPLLLVLWWGLQQRSGAIGRVTGQAARMSHQFFANASLAELMLVALAAGFGEEALFRGFLQPLFAHVGGDIVGLVLASIAFGLAHAMSREYAIVAGVIGLYLGWLYLATGNLMVPIVTHAAYDLVALLWLRRVSV